jgi:hypothetical protein
MVIGDKGERLKRIGTEARQELEKLLDAKVFLEAVGQGALWLGRRRSPRALVSATSKVPPEALRASPSGASCPPSAGWPWLARPQTSAVPFGRAPLHLKRIGLLMDKLLSY